MGTRQRTYAAEKSLHSSFTREYISVRAWLLPLFIDDD
jgi:hypothetical protein